ncbi:three-helix bundle dimerization domain-containing protein [Streptomyces cadmiisoli]|uniref:three-helix bundle dimerization domain-containing protein n=1 Tax=Streptomyces cadmiisoli TaxID=2184053 RepID=UPI00365398CA
MRAGRERDPGDDPHPGGREAHGDDAEGAQNADLVHVAARLKQAFPMAAAETVDKAVSAAHELREARVRSYLSILVERRARRALSSITADEPEARSNREP